MQEKRLYIVLSVLAVYMVAVPIWWKTTEIYRADLPHAEIARWYDADVSLPTQWIHLDMVVVVAEDKFSSQVLREWERKAEEIFKSHLSDFSQRHPDVPLRHGLSASARYLSTSIADTLPLRVGAQDMADLEALADAAYRELDSGQSNWYTMLMLPTQSPTCREPQIILTPYRHSIVLLPVDEASNAQYIAREVIPAISRVMIEVFLGSQLPSQNEVTSQGSYKITFSLLQDAEGWETPILSWPFQEYAQEFLRPFFSQLQDTASYSLDSQMLHFVPLLRQPEKDTTKNCYFYPEAALPHILQHPSEWNQDFLATSQPSLNFIVYIPSKKVSPLRIATAEGYSRTNAFLIPQTGGIIIHNRNEFGSNMPEEEMLEIMGIFMSQLRELMGLPDIQHILSTQHDVANVIPSYEDGISDWELDALLRKRTLENFRFATTNLHSLSLMVTKLTNMVVLDNIQTTVSQSLSALNQTLYAYQDDLVKAHRSSRTAMEKAHEAFYDPRMVGMLYFPDEHKVAVYTPLFLPMLIPLLARVISELKRRRRKNKEKELEKKKQKGE